MISYRLSTGIALCRFDDCAIVLDVNADRYWQLGARLAIALEWVAGNVVTVVPEDDCRRLASLGLVTPGQDGERGTVAPALPFPQQGLEADEFITARRARPLFAFRVFWHAGRSRLAVRFRPLARNLVQVESRRRRRNDAEPATSLSSLASDFRRYRRLLPWRSVCLADSLAFLELAAHYGHYPRLVFGVTRHPFAAHCWVQEEARVLNDRLDHATLFSPILIV
jgi:Transglutaminase-like superfamily